MDINWKDFAEGQHENFELAKFQIQEKTQLLIFSSAWTIREEEIQKDTGKDTLNYWAWRLTPLIESKAVPQFTFLCANRVGKESGQNFIGTSCVLQLRPSCGLVATLGCKEQ